VRSQVVETATKWCVIAYELGDYERDVQCSFGLNVALRGFGERFGCFREVTGVT
jgi:hypothetical protein